MSGTQPFRFGVRVYYEDTDAAGVVYYANYLKFMERARTEWLGSLGFELAELERAHRVAFVVTRVEADFRAPARLGERLDVAVDPVERTRARLVLDQSIARSGDALVSARVTLACLDTVLWRPSRIPQPLVDRLENLA
jgi:acyl-CoA thioester hydrolase